MLLSNFWTANNLTCIAQVRLCLVNFPKMIMYSKILVQHRNFVSTGVLLAHYLQMKKSGAYYTSLHYTVANDNTYDCVYNFYSVIYVGCVIFVPLFTDTEGISEFQ